MESTYSITPDKFKEKCKTLLSYRKDIGKLEYLLLFGSIDECIKKIKGFLEAGVISIHFWAVNNYIEQTFSVKR
jgi:hypothetical protein